MTHYLRNDKVAAADEPKTWDDLLDPKYKGKLVMTDPSFTSLQVSVVGTISKQHGWDYYKKLRGNDVMIVQGNQQVSDMLKRGERLIAVGALDSYAADLRKEGHQVKTLYPTDGVFIIPSPTSVVKNSPHPNAAKLFAEFMIGDDAQKIFPADGGYSVRIDIAAPPGSPDLKTPEDTRCRRRLYRERNPAHQEAVQRDFRIALRSPRVSVIPGGAKRQARNPYPYLPGFWAPPFDCRRFLGSRFQACPLCGARNDGNHANFHHSGGDNSAAPARQCNYRLLEGVA